MKTILLCSFLFVVFLFPSRSYASWEKVPNLPSQVQNTYLLDVFFLKDNPNFGWACGYNGHVLRTTNGGATWLFSAAPVSFQAESIVFLNDKTGYLSGDDMVFKSTDGGATWRQLSLGALPNVWGCAFYDDQNGVAVGGGCTGTLHFYRTTNGGTSWSQTTQSGFDSGLSDAVIYSDGLGYAVSSGLVWRTLDFGSTWDLYSEMNHRNWQEDISHLDYSFLIPMSNGCDGSNIGQGAIFFSTDLGLNWTSHVTPNKLYGSFLTGERSGWAVGKNRSIYHTTNAGKDWELDNCGIETGDNLDDCYFFNDSTGFVVGDGIYYRIKDTRRYFPIAPSKDTVLCEGQSLVIKLYGKYDHYQWSTGEYGDSIIVTQTGRYFIRGTSQCDSSHSDTVDVTFYPVPDLHIKSTKHVLCPEDQIIAYSTEHFDGIVWSTGETKDTIIIQMPGVYSARVTNAYGCSSFDTIEIKQARWAKPKININGKTTFCTGSSALLSVGGPFLSYSWAEVTSPQTVLSTRDTLRVWESGAYFVTVVDTNHCVWESDTVVITVLSASNSLEILNSEDSEFGSIPIMTEKCKKFYIRNNSEQSFTLDELFMFGNNVFSIPQSRFPLIIPALQIDSFVVCFAPRLLGEFADSVLIMDLCSEWNFPVHGVAEANINLGESGCGPDYRFEDTNPNSKNLAIVAIYPSPVRESINIVLGGAMSGEARIRVFNSAGIQVLAESDFTRTSNTLSASVSPLPSGAYCVVAISAGASSSAVFIVE